MVLSFLLRINRDIATIRLTLPDSKKGIAAPNLSHNIPVTTDPSIIEKLESIVISPIADALLLSGTRSETHAFNTPSENAAYNP